MCPRRLGSLWPMPKGKAPSITASSGGPLRSRSGPCLRTGHLAARTGLRRAGHFVATAIRTIPPAQPRAQRGSCAHPRRRRDPGRVLPAVEPAPAAGRRQAPRWSARPGPAAAPARHAGSPRRTQADRRLGLRADGGGNPSTKAFELVDGQHAFGDVDDAAPVGLGHGEQQLQRIAIFALAQPHDRDFPAQSGLGVLVERPTPPDRPPAAVSSGPIAHGGGTIAAA